MFWKLVRPISRQQWASRCRLVSSSSDTNLLKVDWTDDSIVWDDRQMLQSKWSLADKGWNVGVEWKMTRDHGMGVFAKDTILAGTILRRGCLGYNLLQFQSVADVFAFCQEDPAKWRYLADYLWGLHYRTNDLGYPFSPDTSAMFVGMWIPGNGLNHRKQPNTVYRFAPPPIKAQDHGDICLHLVALREILKGEELYDDYRRHGKAPFWLKQLAHQRKLRLNFTDCNDFVQ